jgi:N,N'-diacetyllegionaminate synthase
MKDLFIIAEAGVNHNNNINLALKLVDAAKKAGANAVKFQVFKTENYIKKNAPLASYQRINTKFKNQFEMIKNLELSENNLNKIIRHCKKKKIQFLASPFDFWGIDFLKKKNVPIIKIPSGEINNYPYLKKIGKLKRKIILSSGMSSMGEIKKAIDILQKNGTSKNKITLLQCHSDYPTKLKNINLRVLGTFMKKFKIKVGLSDHSQSMLIPSIAVALGASLIEKHITTDNNMFGPDHKASLNPENFTIMVNNIRDTVTALGSNKKFLSKYEKKNIKIARKSVVALKKIKKGDIFTSKNLTTKRPALGIPASNWNSILGKKAKKNFSIDEYIK